MDRINFIWDQLESDSQLGKGVLKTRYSENTAAEIYLGLVGPLRERVLLLKINAKNSKAVPTGKPLKGIKIEKSILQNEPGFIYINLTLLNKQLHEIFNVLVGDIIDVISTITDENLIIKTFYNRLDSWRILFDKTDSGGLTFEEQRGLYGELFFLRKWLAISSDHQTCLQAWVGQQKALRDFQMKGWAIEVKTTIGNNHQKLHISSERQLDTTSLDHLFLYHLSLEAQQQNGENLNELVNSIMEMLKSDINNQSVFQTKLLEGGYYSNHTPYYENIGYFKRQDSFYHIKDKFPRIEERDLRPGVGDVKYTIIISEYGDYKVDESEIFEIIK